MTPDRERQVGVREGAKTLGIAERTLRRWISEGIVTGHKRKGPRGVEHVFRLGDLLDVRDARKGMIERTHSSPVEDLAQEIRALRESLDDQTRKVEQLAAENRDLRGEVHQLHENILRALPAPKRKFWPWSK